MARHEVVPEEVEQVCGGNYWVLDGKKGRFIVLGETDAGRVLAVILDPEPDEGIYYPVTARSANRKERRLFYEQRGGEGSDDQAA